MSSRLVLITGMLLLLGCGSDPEYVDPTGPLAGTFSETATESDTIYADADAVYLLGDINRPGRYSLPDEFVGDLTLAQLIASGGNLTKTSDLSRIQVLLIRAEPGGGIGISERILRDIFEGTQSDIYLKQNDIVFANTLAK